MERYYFKKGVIIGMILILISINIQPILITSGYQKPDDVYIICNNVNDDTIEINIILPNYHFSEEFIESEFYSSVLLEDEGFTNDIGFAKIPQIRRMIEYPYDAIIEIVDFESDWEELNLYDLNLPSKIIPLQPSLSKNDSFPIEFIIDEEFYKTDEFYPQKTATIKEKGLFRKQPVALIEISPMQYNPFTGNIRLMKSCQLLLKIEKNENIDEIDLKRYDSKGFNSLISNIVINSNPDEKILQNSKNPEGYLIIVYDDFYDEITGFANWKEFLGFSVTVTKTSNIPGGTSNSDIKSYISNAYNTWSDPPVYVLLVGDTIHIPHFIGSACSTATDTYYGCMDSDDFSDVFIGRFSGTTGDEMMAMIDKTISYENRNFASNEYIKKSVFMAGNDNYGITEGTHNYVITNYLAPEYYISYKLYEESYGSDTDDVRDSFNNGRSIAVYSGHGGQFRWADGPVFTQTDIENLNNHRKYPFICSHACVTGAYSEDECFGETWLRVADKGAFAFWGSSANTQWVEDDILEKEMFSAWWDDEIVTIGGMTDQALYELYQILGGVGYSDYYLECYNILGDPSVRIISEIGNNPYKPNNPSPSYGAFNVDVDSTIFTWSGGDPDPDDTVYYDVYLDAWDSTPDNLVSAHQTHMSYDPGTLYHNKHYYWKVVAKDSTGLRNESDVWYFSTEFEPNDCPEEPHSPSPSDDATDISPYQSVINWRGTDPDDEDVARFDVYFEANDPTPDVLVSSDEISHNYDLGLLDWDTTYYWKIIASDGQCNVESPIWSFSTREDPGSYSDHDCISIDGNAGFNSIPGITGAGTSNNPYMLSGWNIYDCFPTGIGIKIYNTTAHFIIENCYIHDCNSAIKLNHVENGIIRYNLIEDCGYQVLSHAYYGNCENIQIYSNTMRLNSGTGVSLRSWPLPVGHYSHEDIIIKNNEFYNNNGLAIDLDNYIYNSTVAENDIHDNENADGIKLDTYSMYNILKNNTIIGAGAHPHYGIRLSTNSNFNIIENNIIRNFDSNHIRLYNADNNIISNNFAYNDVPDDMNSISIEIKMGSSNNTVKNNIIYHNGRDGLKIDESNSVDNMLINNSIHHCDRRGIVMSSRNHAINNSIFFVNDTGISITHGHDTFISGNIVYDCGWLSAGISLFYCDHMEISKNTVYNTPLADGGIYLYTCHNMTISQNLLYNNRYSINITGGKDNLINSNYLNDSIHAGIYVRNTIQNLFYNNYFSNSQDYVTINAHNNQWNISKIEKLNIIGGEYQGGNRWTNCTSIDTDSDGLGDTNLPFGPGDNAPLVQTGMDIILSEIYDIYADPSVQYVNQPINISCLCTDNTELSEVILFINPPDINCGNDSTINVTMLNIEDTNIYFYNSSYSIPGIYDFYIFARDKYNNTNISSIFNFEILDFQDPIEIINEYPKNNSVNVERPPNILNATILSMFGSNMDIYIMHKQIDFYHKDEWSILESFISVKNGTYGYNPNGNIWIWGDTKYTWSVNVTDGSYWTNKTFTFTTGGSLYDVNNNDVVNFQDAGLCWVNRDSVVDYDGLYDVNQNGGVNFQDAGLCWVNRD